MSRAARAAAVVALVPVAVAVHAFVAWNVLVRVGPWFEIPALPAIDPPPSFVGDAAEPRPIDTPPAPQHPFMAPNGRSSIHVDAYMSDANTWPGPLGLDPGADSTYQVGACGTLTFDSRGRIVTLCLRPLSRFMAVFDPATLDRLATHDLPPRRGGLGALLGGGTFTDFSGGGYFYLDHRDRAVVPTTTNHVYVIAVEGEGADPELRRVRDMDLSSAIPDDDSINSVLPDWEGRLWFVTTGGIVGTVPRGGGEPRTLELRESIENSFAVDETGGVYVVTGGAMYRFDARPSGRPRVSWRQPYPNSGERKPGQTDAASGTTPTLIGRRWVAIADNAEQMGIVVYRREAGFEGRRQVCRQPVFERGRGATENTLIGIGRTVMVENNYGYTGPVSTMLGGSTEPGFARVDIVRRGQGCRLVWQSEVRAPSVVPKLSLATGLVYTYTKPAGSTSAPWYLTALDFRTGRTVFQAQAGRGTGHNNNYAPVTLGAGGTAYVGVLGGLVRIADRD